MPEQPDGKHTSRYLRTADVLRACAFVLLQALLAVRGCAESRSPVQWSAADHCDVPAGHDECRIVGDTLECVIKAAP